MASYSSSTQARKYEVFLSFRGEDTRNTFVGHLYRALVQKGIVTYKDDPNLEKGQSISPEVMKAIEESQFAIIVFSKNYASSTWCLDELAKIMECKTERGLTVIPIFYDVDPSDVREQKNSFAESFAKHEMNFKDNIDKVQNWKKNLFKAGGLTGVDISGKDEASCISNIVEEIFTKLLPEPSTKDLVGMESRMMELRSVLFKEPNGVHFVGILGMGGIGKTTLARAIFYNFIHKFEAGCFLQDVSKKHDMVDLQRTLLSKILRLERVYVTDEYEGCRMIGDRLRFKKVLLVLDDVNHSDQLKSLAAEAEWFGIGSRIIITTRDEELLNDVNETYKVDLLPDSEAMNLFCWHAFKQIHPPQDFSQLSNRVVRYASGLPLALKVLGSHLHRKRTEVWESVLERLRDAPEKDVDAKLRISFDGLCDIQKEAFLDIACFHRRCREDDVKEMLHSCGFHPGESITVLVQRSLIDIVEGEIQMHDLIKEMGQYIVRQRANFKPKKYTRLWLEDDINNALANNTGIAKVEALNPSYYLSSETGICGEWFKKMNKLRLLKIFEVTPALIGALDYLPNTLQFLRWRGYGGKHLPKDFRPINLVHLDLSGSSIVATPDVSCMPYLEVLELGKCGNLLEVHPSIGVHKKLVRLVLSYCSNLNKFPRIIQMESLEILDLCGCLQFHGFLEIHKNTSRLRKLDLSWTKIEGLHCSDGGPTSLQELNLIECENLRLLPCCLVGIQHPQFIRLGGCKMLKELPELPSSMKKLDPFGRTSLIMIPSVVDLLDKWEHLQCENPCTPMQEDPLDQNFEGLHHQET